MELRSLLSLSVLVLALSACGGTKLVKNAPPPPQLAEPLAAAADASLGARLDWVTVRNGSGSWARNADWDEYLMRVDNRAAAPISVTRIAVHDSLGSRLAPESDRSRLVKASKQSVRRYKDSGIRIQSGMGGGGLLALGAGSTAAGIGYGSTLSLGIMGGASSSSAAFGAAAGMIVAGPILATIGIVRAVRNGKVDNRIEQRHTPLPLALAAGQSAAIDVFFPIAPSPLRVEITYTDATGEHQLDLDTHAVLAGLHLDTPSKATAAALEAATTVTAP